MGGVDIVKNVDKFFKMTNFSKIILTVVITFIIYFLSPLLIIEDLRILNISDSDIQNILDNRTSNISIIFSMMILSFSLIMSMTYDKHLLEQKLIIDKTYLIELLSFNTSLLGCMFLIPLIKNHYINYYNDLIVFSNYILIVDIGVLSFVIYKITKINKEWISSQMYNLLEKEFISEIENNKTPITQDEMIYKEVKLTDSMEDELIVEEKENSEIYKTYKFLNYFIDRLNEITDSKSDSKLLLLNIKKFHFKCSKELKEREIHSFHHYFFMMIYEINNVSLKLVILDDLNRLYKVLFLINKIQINEFKTSSKLFIKGFLEYKIELYKSVFKLHHNKKEYSSFIYKIIHSIKTFSLYINENSSKEIKTYFLDSIYHTYSMLSYEMIKNNDVENFIKMIDEIKDTQSVELNSENIDPFKLYYQIGIKSWLYHLYFNNKINEDKLKKFVDITQVYSFSFITNYEKMFLNNVTLNREINFGWDKFDVNENKTSFSINNVPYYWLRRGIYIELYKSHISILSSDLFSNMFDGLGQEINSEFSKWKLILNEISLPNFNEKHQNIIKSLSSTNQKQ